MPGTTPVGFTSGGDDKVGQRPVSAQQFAPAATPSLLGRRASPFPAKVEDGEGGGALPARNAAHYPLVTPLPAVALRALPTLSWPAALPDCVAKYASGITTALWTTCPCYGRGGGLVASIEEWLTELEDDPGDDFRTRIAIGRTAVLDTERERAALVAQLAEWWVWCQTWAFDEWGPDHFSPHGASVAAKRQGRWFSMLFSLLAALADTGTPLEGRLSAASALRLQVRWEFWFDRLQGVVVI